MTADENGGLWTVIGADHRRRWRYADGDSPESQTRRRLTMATSSRRCLILAAAVCAFGGFLLGSSSSQDKDKNDSDRRGAEGRYQLVANTQFGTWIVFDTRTARGWAISGNAFHPDLVAGDWKAIASPFDPVTKEIIEKR